MLGRVKSRLQTARCLKIACEKNKGRVEEYKLRSYELLVPWKKKKKKKIRANRLLPCHNTGNSFANATARQIRRGQPSRKHAHVESVIRRDETRFCQAGSILPQWDDDQEKFLALWPALIRWSSLPLLLLLLLPLVLASIDRPKSTRETQRNGFSPRRVIKGRWRCNSMIDTGKRNPNGFPSSTDAACAQARGENRARESHSRGWKEEGWRRKRGI